MAEPGTDNMCHSRGHSSQNPHWVRWGLHPGGCLWVSQGKSWLAPCLNLTLTNDNISFSHCIFLALNHSQDVLFRPTEKMGSWGRRIKFEPRQDNLDPVSKKRKERGPGFHLHPSPQTNKQANKQKSGNSSLASCSQGAESSLASPRTFQDPAVPFLALWVGCWFV